MNDWSNMDSLSLGRCAELYAQLDFLIHGYHVYLPDVDNHGVDLLVEKNNQKFYVQVKSVRNNNYTYVRKESFHPTDDYLLYYVRFVEGESPERYIIPGGVFKRCKEPFKSYDYGKKGQKSKPEYGISVSKTNRKLLEQYQADNYFA